MKATRAPKQTTAPGVMRTVVGKNLAELLDYHYSELPNRTARVMELAKRSGVGHGTIQRAIDGSASATVDTLERLALALDVSPYQLFVTDLDIRNPQVINGAGANEMRLYSAFKLDALKRPPLPPAAKPRKPKKGGDENAAE